MLTVALGLVVGAVAAWGVAAAGLWHYGRRAPVAAERFDAIVVLGCRVFPSGRPSTALAQRARLAVSLYDAGYAPRMIFTGGVGDAPIAESEAAAAIARELGVPEAAMFAETKSTSTEENAKFAAELGAAEHVLVVTDAYHVVRAQRVFARYFSRARAVGATHPHLGPTLRGSLREVLAIAAYAARGRL